MIRSPSPSVTIQRWRQAEGYQVNEGERRNAETNLTPRNNFNANIRCGRKEESQSWPAGGACVTG